MSYFNLGTITFPAEGENDINTWADYCELFCLLSEDKAQTIDQLQDRLIEDSDTVVAKAAKRLALTTTSTGRFVAPLLEAEDTELEDAEIEEDYVSTNPDAKFLDKLQSEFRFLFAWLKSRKIMLGNTYPFEIEGNRISVNASLLTNRQKLYISLCLSAVLRIYASANINKLGHVFEEFCGSLFKKLVPDIATIQPFGAGGQVVAPFFSGTFFQKVEKLSVCIKTDLSTEFINNRHDHQHFGDGGLDWVGWLPFSDGRSRMPLFFGQCACGSDWVDKEFDAHEDKWNNNLQFNDKYLLYHFITKLFRKQDGDWYQPSKLNYGIILIDRFRIVSILSDEEVDSCIALYTDLVDEAIAARLSNIE